MNSKELSEVHQCFRRGEYAVAERKLRSILGLERPDSSHLVLLGAILAKQEQFEEGLAFLEKALRQDESSIEGWIWFSVCLRHLGRLNEAETACLNALKQNPDDARSNFNLGLCCIASRQFERAVNSLTRALDVQRDNPQILQNLGLAHQGAGNFEKAVSCFQKSIEVAPTAASGYIALGNLILKTSDNKGALNYAMQALKVSLNDVSAHVLAAKAYTLLNRAHESRPHLKMILDADPENSVAYAMLGFALQNEGDFEAASRAFETSLKFNPDQGAARWGILQGKKCDAEDRKQLPRLLQLAQDQRLDPSERAYLYYSAGKINDDTRDYGEALKSYDSANALAAKAAFGTHRFDPKFYRSVFAKTREIFSAGFLKQHRDLRHDSDRPILIIGMIRSGTTLLEQILSSHPDVAAGGELPFWLERGLPCVNLATATVDRSKSRQVVGDYLKLLEDISGTATRVTDKMPQNLQLLGLIHILFPKAKVVNMNRNPADNCLSIYTTPFAFPPEYALNRENIALAYEENRRLTAHWHKVLPTGTMIDVSYEELTVDPEATIRTVLDHCGLPWSDSCLKPQENQRRVNTPSLWQVRQPIYQSSKERWRNYAGVIPEFERLLDNG